MLFNSSQFVLYFIIVTTVYFLLPHRFRWLHLLLASCYFYMTFVPIYILILFGTIILDYFAGIYIERTEDNERLQKGILVSSVVLNVAVLGVFKYYNFFIGNVNAMGAHLPLLRILLPIGLSFHTFQALAYLFEVYRGNQKAERHFGIYSLYVMFYPQLVAGPIERPQHVLPQFFEKHPFSLDNLFAGLRLMLWGFFKKVVVADRLTVYVDAVYGNPALYSNWMNVVLAFFFFTMQVYCDFSGYSDIAIGAAQTMGFRLMVNFNRPFFSRSLSEFWRRWHISLSSWFNDYLFSAISASARRMRQWGIVLAVLITFSVSGLWHGAAWTFVLFGVFHGLGIVFEILTKNTRLKAEHIIPKAIFRPLTLLLTFAYVNFTIVFFRARSIQEALIMLKNAFTLHKAAGFQVLVRAGNNEFGMVSMLISFLMIGLMLLVESRTTPQMNELGKKYFTDIAFCSFIGILVFAFGVFQKTSFIYFQF